MWYYLIGGAGFRDENFETAGRNYRMDRVFLLTNRVGGSLFFDRKRCRFYETNNKFKNKPAQPANH